MPLKPSSDLIEHWFIFQEEHLLFVQASHELELPTHHSLSAFNLNFSKQYHFGTFNQTHCVCAELNLSTPLPQELKFIPLRKAFDLLGENWFPAAAKASSILKWDINHQFCGRCGHSTLQHLSLTERQCPSCGLIIYPRISPSIIVLISNGNEILMSRSPHFPKGSYGLIAGFVELGESLEDAVYREVKEEVGIKIKNLTYFDSQFWPFPDSLMVGFTAEYAGGELVIDHREIEAAGWYRYDNLPGKPSTNISIASKLIHYFITKHNQGS